jgi:hypothetical protein
MPGNSWGALFFFYPESGAWQKSLVSCPINNVAFVAIKMGRRTMADKATWAASVVLLVVRLERPVDRTITHFGGEPH